MSIASHLESRLPNISEFFDSDAKHLPQLEKTPTQSLPPPLHSRPNSSPNGHHLNEGTLSQIHLDKSSNHFKDMYRLIQQQLMMINI